MKNLDRILRGMCAAALLPVACALLMGSGPVRAAATDAAIEAAAKDSFVFKNYLQNDTIAVESKDGSVTLKGLVAEEPHKALAQETVESLVGVVSVDNQLQIKTEGAIQSDALISSRVKLAIMSHRTLRGLDVRVVVENGMVTLLGTAKSKAQMDLTTQYVKDVEGVVAVKNDMLVADGSEVGKTMGEKADAAGRKIGDKVEDVGKKIGDKTSDMAELIDDASITAMVKATLLYHRSTSALRTKVGTKDGVVTLSGTASSSAARELATQVVEDVHGVRGVVNVMVLAVGQ
jgi:hyperosmotically inducible periplasmic protein